MFDELVDYISKNYSRAQKIVEVGVGHRIDIARRVKEKLPTTEIIVTDIDETWSREHRIPNVKAIVDDATNPQLPVYRNASLIYALHPPIELIPSLEKICDKVDSDLVIVPISDEREDFISIGWKKIVQQGKTIGLLKQKRQQQRRNKIK